MSRPPKTATVPSLWRKYVVLLPATWTTFAPADKTVRFGERWYPPNVGTDHPTTRPSPSNATESPGHPPKARAPSICCVLKGVGHARYRPCPDAVRRRYVGRVEEVAGDVDQQGAARGFTNPAAL